MNKDIKRIIVNNIEVLDARGKHNHVKERHGKQELVKIEIKTIQNELKTKDKKKKKMSGTICELWNNFNYPSNCVIGVPEVERGTEKYLKK